MRPCHLRLATDFELTEFRLRFQLSLLALFFIFLCKFLGSFGYGNVFVHIYPYAVKQRGFGRRSSTPAARLTLCLSPPPSTTTLRLSSSSSAPCRAAGSMAYSSPTSRGGNRSKCAWAWRGARRSVPWRIFLAPRPFSFRTHHVLNPQYYCHPRLRPSQICGSIMGMGIVMAGAGARALSAIMEGIPSINA